MLILPQPSSSRSHSPHHSGRSNSPTHPKPLRAHDGFGTPSSSYAEFEPERRRRSSPMPFYGPGVSTMPPRAGSLQLEGLLSKEWHSMAGLINAQDLRHATQEHFDPEPMIKACVKVFVTQVMPSYALPWARGEEARSTGSGFVVELPAYENKEVVHPNASGAAPGCKCIVTNAHVVENFSLVQVWALLCAEHFILQAMATSIS